MTSKERLETLTLNVKGTMTFGEMVRFARKRFLLVNKAFSHEVVELCGKLKVNPNYVIRHANHHPRVSIPLP